MDKTPTMLMAIKLVAIVIVVFAIAAAILGCRSLGDTAPEDTETEEVEYYSGGYFIVEKKWSDFNGTYRIVYAKDNGVKYFVRTGTDSCAITPLLNSDGTAQVADDYGND
jgi:hypothetical protein